MNPSPSKSMPGVRRVISESSALLAMPMSRSPILGIEVMKDSTSCFRRMANLPVILRLKKEERAPTFFEMDISLSLSTTTRSFLRWPAWFNPSKARPAVREPSPMTENTLKSSPCRSRAAAMPRAADMEVDEWPTPKAS